MDYERPVYQQHNSRGYAYLLRAEYHGGGKWQATVRLIDNSHLSTVPGYANSSSNAISSAMATISKWNRANGHPD